MKDSKRNWLKNHEYFYKNIQISISFLKIFCYNDNNQNFSERRVSLNIFYLLKPKANVAYLNKTNTIRQGLEKMREYGYTAIPVIDDNGEYIGTVSEGDFLWHLLNYKDDIRTQENFCIIDIVNEDRNRPVKIDVTMDELLLKVMDQNFVPVLDDRNIFIGIITRRDIIKYFYHKAKEKNYNINH